MKKFLQLIALIIAYPICAILLSLCYGMIASELYYLLKGVLEFDKIKMIVDVVSTSITILVLPFFIYGFWKIIKSLKRLNFKTYALLLSVLVAFYCLGMVFTIVSHTMPNVTIPTVVKGIAVLAFVIANFCITGKVCIEGGKQS